MVKRTHTLQDQHRTGYSSRTTRRTSTKSRKKGMAKTHAFY